MRRVVALAFAAAVGIALPPVGPSASEPIQYRLAQGDSPSFPPPPPVVVRPRVPPEPLANRPERTQARTGPQPALAARADVQIEADIVIARVPGNADAGLGDLVAQAHGLSLAAQTRLALLDQQMLRFRIPDDRSVAEVAQALANDDRLEAVQPSFVYELQAGADTAPQYTVEKLDLPAVHAMSRGAGVRVALIDTGIDRAHAALRGARLRTLSILGAGRPRAADHGTQMAGIIVASGPFTGVAPAAELIAIEAFRAAPGDEAATARSHSLAVAQGLDLVAQEGAQVVNLSFAGGEDPLISDLLDRLDHLDVVLIGAAGNDGPRAAPAYPAAHPAVIAVTAVDASNELFPSANRGSYITLAAPGVDVLAPSAGERYRIISGTSAAASHVSGIVALMLARNPNMGPGRVTAILARTAVDLGMPGHDPEYGAGLVDPSASLIGLSSRLAQPTE